MQYLFILIVFLEIILCTVILMITSLRPTSVTAYANFPSGYPGKTVYLIFACDYATDWLIIINQSVAQYKSYH